MAEVFTKEIAEDFGEEEMDFANLKKHIPTLISLWRGNGKKKGLDRNEIKTLSASLLKLQRGLTGKRNLVGQSYMSDKNLFGAYLLYYFPISYLQIQSIIGSVQNEFEKIAEAKTEKIRILEIGSGPAPGTTAIIDRIRKLNENAKIEVVLLDSSKNALEIAKKVIQTDFENVSVETHVTDLENEKILSKIGSGFSVILLSHVLNELWKNNGDKISLRLEFLSKAKNLLDSENALLILNEPALLESSRNLMKVRDAILKSEDFSNLDLISPCPHSLSKSCPALSSENQTCHAENFFDPIEPIKSLAHGAGLDRESVKMCFFVFKTDNKNAQSDDKNTSLTVVSEGMLNKSGRIRFMLCDGEKRFSLSAKKDDAHAKEIGFFKLHRYEKIRIENPEIRQDNLGVKDDTKIHINFQH